MSEVRELNIDFAGILDDIVDAIATNAPGNIPVDYIEDCFQIKNKGNCDFLVVQDLTDYAGLTGIDVDESIIYASLYKTDSCVCGEDELIVAEAEYSPGDTWRYEDLDEGTYEVRIRLDYDVTVSSVHYPNTIKNIVLKSTLDCCGSNIEDLKTELVEKIGALACKIQDYGYIGRNFTKLLDNQYALQGVLWAISTCYINCDDFQKFKCFADKIITDCNC